MFVNAKPNPVLAVGATLAQNSLAQIVSRTQIVRLSRVSNAP